jgi:hypothetical protein
MPLLDYLNYNMILARSYAMLSEKKNDSIPLYKNLLHLLIANFSQVIRIPATEFA